MKLANHTYLITLGCRAKASHSFPELNFEDEAAEEMALAFSPQIDQYTGSKELIKSIVMRTAEIDECVVQFASENKHLGIVSIGCGMCTRSSRLAGLSNKAGWKWYDLDYPEIIELRNQHITPDADVTRIASAVMELSWIDAIQWEEQRAYLFIMEGVACYLPIQNIRELFFKLASIFQGHGPPVILIFDNLHPQLIEGQRLMHQFGNDELKYLSGFSSVGELEEIHPSLRVQKQIDLFSKISEGHQEYNQRLALRFNENMLYSLIQFVINEQENGPQESKLQGTIYT